MKNNVSQIVLFVFLSSLGCASSKNNTTVVNVLPAAELQPYGRSFIEDKKQLELISSAVHFGFSFEGVSCEIFASIGDHNGHNYLQYELDGIYQKRIKIEGKDSLPIVITSPSKGKHTVWIYKATEAHTGNIAIRKIYGQNIKALNNSNAPSIEFIGNSITCGAAADPSEMPCGTGQYHDQHNAYMAYGPVVSRALHSNFILSSVSGIGIYRNWNSDGPTMPQVYEKIDFQIDNNSLWNFTVYQPKIVSIALGTNDFSNGDGKRKRLPFDTAAFINNYVQFVQLIKLKYPAAQIALLSSPMINGDARITLQNCLSSVKQKVDALYSGKKQIALFFFEPMQAHGCGGHPDVDDHATCYTCKSVGSIP
ncbi:SGNH/GDSL hydrolase family protein [soil metagenome]